MNGYTLSKNWFGWSFENPEKHNPSHTALYHWIIEKWNSSGQKEKISLPSSQSMEAIGVKSYKTYIKTLRELIDFGFILMVNESTNQYTCNIIALVNFTEAHTKALTKALPTHIPKHSLLTYQSTPEASTLFINNKYKTINKETINNILEVFSKFSQNKIDKILKDLVSEKPKTKKEISLELLDKRKDELKLRKLAFFETIKKYQEKYTSETLNKFATYWSEPTHTFTQMKFEKCPTWDVGGRLATWFSNQDKYNKSSNKSRLESNVDAVMKANQELINQNTFKND